MEVLVGQSCSVSHTWGRIDDHVPWLPDWVTVRKSIPTTTNRKSRISRHTNSLMRKSLSVVLTSLRAQCAHWGNRCGVPGRQKACGQRHKRNHQKGDDESNRIARL